MILNQGTSILGDLHGVPKCQILSDRAYGAHDIRPTSFGGSALRNNRSRAFTIGAVSNVFFFGEFSTLDDFQAADCFRVRFGCL